MKLYSVQLLTFTILLAYGWVSPGACTCFPDRGTAVRASSGEDTLRLQPREIANEYISALDLTSWSMELGRWLTEHRYTEAVDTFHQMESYQWPYEQYCFRTRAVSNRCTTEYSFFDNGDYCSIRTNPDDVSGVAGSGDRETEIAEAEARHQYRKDGVLFYLRLGCQRREWAKVNKGESPVKTDCSAFQKMASRALTGKGSHALTADVFGGLNWQIAGARPMGVPHSVFQLVNHIVFWEEWGVRWLGGKSPKVPAHAAGSWPGKVKPANRGEWNRIVRRHREALRALDRGSRRRDLLIKRGKWTPLEMLHLIASHTSYHIGEVVAMRQLVASWPPPRGGLTW